VTPVCYEQLALDWSPANNDNRQFNVIVLAVVFVMLLAGIVISSITVPGESRVARSVVPERIADFLIEKKKSEPKKVKPESKPKPKQKLKAKTRPKPEVKKRAKAKAQKPLTKTQKKSREKATESGLLALSNELSDLMDTSDASAMLGGNIKSSSASAAAVTSQNKTLLMAGASQGSSGVDAVEYTAAVGRTQVKQSQFSSEVQSKATSTQANKSRSAGIRTEEAITIVFDQNKSKLYSIYNRARRTNPNLKGKIVLEITISPAGKVIKIKVVSSELNDSRLESRLVKRIKLFSFGAMKVEQVIVTYPIEFLPS
jgi:protein TonB